MKLTKRTILKLALYFTLIAMLIAMCSLTTIAYFKFQKVYDGVGELPILNLQSEIKNATTLKNLSYNGETEKNISLNLTSTGNNMAGFVRVKAVIVWSNALNNTPEGENGAQIIACSLNYDNSVWEKREGYLYLKEALNNNSEVIVFDKIIFDENIPQNYLGENVSVYLFAEIYQEANFPSNWEVA